MASLFSIFDYFLTKRGNNRYNVFLSLYINCKYLPLKQAKKLPIAIYGNFRIIAIGNGTISIDSDDISHKMIKINQTNESVANSGGDSELMFKGKKIIFHGHARIGTGCRIMSYAESEISIGRNFIMNNQNFIGSCGSLIIGDDVVIGHQNQIFDTDFHFLYNVSKSEVLNNKARTVIGNNVWISNRVTINKGTIIPDDTIIASNTLVSKNLSSTPGYIWGGVPCKLLSLDVHKALFNELEWQIYGYFEKNMDINSCRLTQTEYENRKLLV